MSERATPKGSAYLAPPVQRAARLLKHIAAGDPVENMSITAKALKINRTTLLRLLHTLEVEGFIEKRPGGGFQIGLSLLTLTAQSFFSQDIVQMALPIVSRLADTLHLSAHLGVLDGTDVLYLLRRTPNMPLASTIRVGSRLPAHATTMGRVMLAHLDEAALAARFVGRTLMRFTDRTPTDIAALTRQLADDRHLGLAWSDGAFETHVGSVAVPVIDYTGACVAALNVSGPVDAFAERSRRTAIGAALMAAGLEASQRLGWVAPRTEPIAPARRARVERLPEAV